MGESNPENEQNPAASSDAAALPLDADALLSQTEALVAQAASELGGVEPAPAPPADLAPDAPPAETVEQQLAAVSELVAEANRQAAAWAGTGATSEPARTPDALAETADAARTPASSPAQPAARAAEPVTDAAAVSSVAAGAAAATEAPPAESVRAGGTPGPQSVGAPPLMTLFGGAQVDLDLSPAPRPPAGVRLGRGALRMARGGLQALNYPFLGVPDSVRETAGLVAVATALVATVLWLLPLLAR